MKAKKQVVKWRDEKEVLDLLEKAAQPYFGEVAIHELINLWCHHRDRMMSLLGHACSSQVAEVRVGVALFLEKEIGYFKCGMCQNEERVWLLSCVKALNKGSNKQLRQVMKRSLDPKDFSHFGKVQPSQKTYQGS
jgi:hypothetical protein